MYVSTSFIDLQSIDNSEYLKKQLSSASCLQNGNIIYYKNRISYEYDGDNKRVKVYKLVDIAEINPSAISEIMITDSFKFGYLTTISNDLTLSDRSWMKTVPLEKIIAGGYYCDYQIFVHKKSVKITQIQKELDLKMKEWKDIELSNQNGNTYGNEIRKIMDKFNGLQVVVISFCSA